MPYSSLELKYSWLLQASFNQDPGPGPIPGLIEGGWINRCTGSFSEEGFPSLQRYHNAFLKLNHGKKLRTALVGEFAAYERIRIISETSAFIPGLFSDHAKRLA